MSAIEFRLNGEPVRVDSVSPNITLLEWLRTSGLTGSKEGCAEGDCGACSVAIVDRDARGKRCYRAINSCLVPLPLMAGRYIVTVEGVTGAERVDTATRLQPLVILSLSKEDSTVIFMNQPSSSRSLLGSG